MTEARAKTTLSDDKSGALFPSYYVTYNFSYGTKVKEFQHLAYDLEHSGYPRKMY